MKPMTIEVTFHADWHIGTGSSGDGSIDRRIARDEDGFPFIPAKSLTGILRDSCEEVLEYLGLDADPERDNWATYVFGRANVSSQLRIRAARIDETSRGYLYSFDARERSVLSKALATVKPGVAIDSLSGRAKDDHLSFMEVARPMVLSAHIEFLDSAPEVVSLVASACRLVEYIGAKRRRGLGRCTVRLYSADGVEITHENQLVEHQRILSSLSFSIPSASSVMREPQLVVDQQLEQITLTFTANSPLMFPKQKMGNVVTSYDYIPGSAILPVLHEVISQAGFDAQSLIRSGQVKAGRGLPVFGDQTSFPTPFVVSVVKNNQSMFVNNSLFDSEDVVTKQVRTGWITKGDGETLVLHRVPFVSNTHNSVSDFLQRPSEDVGGIFTYESIAPGQAFRSSVTMPKSVINVLFKNDGDAGRDSPIAISRTGIGTSRKDDYGDVELMWDRRSDIGETFVQLDGNSLQIWCVSDVVLPHQPGSGLVDSAKRAIAEALGVSTAQISINMTKTRVRPMRVDSWHGRWGLPRTTLFGIAAGSCLSLTWDEAVVTNDSVSEMLRKGIGLRQTEGFGSVVVNHEILSLTNGQIVEGNIEKLRLKRSNEGEISLALLRAVRAAIRESVRIRTTEIARLSTSELPRWWKPSNTGNADGQNHQFAILRRLTMQITTPLSEEAKQQFMHDFDAWDKGSRDAAWNLLSNELSIWSDLGDFEHPLGTGVESIPTRIRNEMWSEAVRALVEGIHRRRTRSAR